MTAGPEEIAHAIARLKAGGLVAFPTETVYGLGASALDAAAVARVFARKGRPPSNPLIVHVSGEEMARRVTASWPEGAHALARAFWPGPLTLVLPRAGAVPTIVTGGGPNVAVRCPEHPLTLALLEALGEPLVGPSANVSGSVSPTRAEHVRESFPGDEVYVLDGGPCRAGIESTVVTLAETPARVLRPGVIGAAEISAALGAPVTAFSESAPAPPHGPLPAPGMLARHYAPAHAARLVGRAELEALLRNGAPRLAVIAHEPVEVPPPHELIALSADAGTYAAGLYGALRAADAHHPDLIVILRPPSGPGAVWEAVADRLARATSRV